jgi:hypothetical protein
MVEGGTEPQPGAGCKRFGARIIEVGARRAGCASGMAREPPGERSYCETDASGLPDVSLISAQLFLISATTLSGMGM